MSQHLGTDTSQPLSTTTGRMAAIRLKNANSQIFRALLSLSSAALLMRVAGFLNQIVVSGRFGAGAAMDAYFVASSLPILMAQLLESAIEASVIPIYTRVRVRGSKEQVSRLFSTLLNLLLLGTTLLTVVLFVFRDQMILLSAPGLDPTRKELSIGLTPFIFPMLLLMVVIGFLECILNTEGQFGWPAYAGMLVPCTTAIFVLAGGQAQGIVLLCIGMGIGLCLQLCVIGYRARRAKLVYRLTIDWRNPTIALVLIAAWPELFNALISQASPIVDQIFASSLPVGSISALSYSLKLVSVPTGVIFASVGRAMLPYLSRQATAKDLTAFKGTLRLYLWAVGIATTVLAVFMSALAHPLVQLLFQRGAFSADDTNRTASTLIGFLVGLTPMSLGFITAKAFTALGKNRTLLYVTLFSVIANAVFDYIFARFWQNVGIALSTSAVYFCTMFIMLFTLRSMIGKLYLFTPPHQVLSVIWKLGMGQYYIQWVIWKEENLQEFRLPYSLYRQIIRICVILSVFAAGIVGSIFNIIYMARIAFGSIIVLYLLRYRYVLLIVWVLLNAFIGSNLPIFNGQNFLTGLTAPSLLLLFVLPTKDAFKRMPALAFFLAYLVWVFAGIGIAPIPLGTFLTQWIITLDSVAVSVLTISVLTTPKRLLGLIDSILLPSIFIALYGIYGYFTRQNGILDTTSSFFRTSSVFGNGPTTLALFLSIIIPLSIYRTFTLQGIKRVGGTLVVLLLLATLGLTFTRGALLSVPLSMLIMILFLPSQRLRTRMLCGMIGIAGLIVLAATIGNIPIFSRFLNSDVTTLNGRTYLWTAVIDHFDPTQLLGKGMQASDVLLTNLQVQGGGLGVIGTASHNIFLETLYDYGIIGLILLMLMFISIPVKLFTKIRTATPDYRMLLGMTIAIFFNVVVQSLESNDFWNPSISIYFWIAMSLPFALCWTTLKSAAATDEDIVYLPGSSAGQQQEDNLHMCKITSTYVGVE